MDIKNGHSEPGLHEREKTLLIFYDFIKEKLEIIEHNNNNKEIAHNLSISPSKRNNIKYSPWHMVEAH